MIKKKNAAGRIPSYTLLGSGILLGLDGDSTQAGGHSIWFAVMKIFGLRILSFST